MAQDLEEHFGAWLAIWPIGGSGKTPYGVRSLKHNEGWPDGITPDADILIRSREEFDTALKRFISDKPKMAVVKFSPIRDEKGMRIRYTCKT